MEEIDEEFVTPGEELGTSEEWLPGKGAHEEAGMICASVFGKVEYDEENLEANVVPVNPISEIEEGKIIYGRISRNQGSIASLDIGMIEGESRGIARDIEASLHVSKISDDYVDSVEAVLKKGDIIRAKVIQSEPSIQVKTTGKNLGVVKAYCTKCRKPMKKKDSKLYCSYCERYESRKTAKVYGKIKLKDREKSSSK